VPTDAFWSLLERTRPGDGDVGAHAEAITEALAAGGVEVTRAWATDFDDALDALDHWDVWGAAYLALGGCSDDAYEYTRCWIVGRGRDAWTQARDDPDAYFAGLFEGIDPDGAWQRVDALGNLDGEPLLYAGGIAHERLTGAWLPARAPREGARPRGEPWEEADLPARLPRLSAALPDLSSTEDDAPFPDASLVPEVAATFMTARSAFERGDHAAVVDALAPVLDDPVRWGVLMLRTDLPVDAAYMGGISRLVAGDPDGAAAWLRLVVDSPDVPPHVRRALAQVELSRGELDAAIRLLDDRADAALLDRALRMVAALRAGELDDARRRADDLEHTLAAGTEGHAWDEAGIHAQLGFVLVELHHGSRAAAAADAIVRLTSGASARLPLIGQERVLRAGALRLAGDLDGAAAILDGVRDTLEDGTCDRGLAEREDARVLRARGLDAAAREAYETAVRTLDAAGERWLADETRREGGGA
jgi:uncharacterized protein DUF4240